MTEQFKPPRMETIKATAELFGLPVYFVRQKVASGEVVAVRAGRKFLVNIERFGEYLNNSRIAPESGEVAATIKPIKVR